MTRVLVTGGAGFIGSALIRHLIRTPGFDVLNVDKLTYAGDQRSLESAGQSPRYQFLQADICDGPAMRGAFEAFKPDVVVHLAAESHVDRSIDRPGDFMQTNVIGTFVLLAEATRYWRSLTPAHQDRFRFHQVSTDEVFGTLSERGQFTESTPYDPRSPYSASKAAADHIVRAWGHTYGLPVIVTNCSNNYGPFQFPEKLIPLMTIKGMAGDRLPIYGTGENVRDWLHVDDHASALVQVFSNACPAETFLIGGQAERSNQQVVECICDCLDRLRPKAGGHSHREQITHVADRPGHDLRYAVDPSKLVRELGWKPQRTFEEAILETVEWYLANEWWWRPILTRTYSGERLGLAKDEQTGNTV